MPFSLPSWFLAMLLAVATSQLTPPQQDSGQLTVSRYQSLALTVSVKQLAERVLLPLQSR